MRAKWSLRARGRAMAAAALAVAAAALFAASPAGVGPAPPAAAQEAADVDMDLLRESLLKLWIIEESSSKHNQRKIAETSFEALIAPDQPTGDPAKDKENAEGRRKLNFKVKTFLLLELDGAIECMDIADRILGTKVTLSAGDAATRRLMTKECPAISWNGVSLESAFADLSRKLGTPIKFPTLPRTLTLEISYDAPAGMTLFSVLSFINSEHPIEWKLVDGTLDVRYLGEIPPETGGRR